MTSNDILEAMSPLVATDSLILVTGASGFIGSKVVERLLVRGFRNIRCLVRPSSNLKRLAGILERHGASSDCIVPGNLLSKEDCKRIVDQAALVYHLAAGSEKSFAGSFLNTVVTTRNLLQATSEEKTVRRFVNVSSFAVYSNQNLSRHSVLDESCPVDADPRKRAEPYAWAKAEQDQQVREYGRSHGLKYVIVRPGSVFGPGKGDITPRVGIDTFGIFLHLGGGNTIPFTYVDNCAEAIVLAGLMPGIENNVYNVVDDDLPSSRRFLRLVKKSGRSFKHLPVPYPMFYCFCYFWERFSKWSKGQLPPAFNRARCAVYWKGNRYSNRKLKHDLGWRPQVNMSEALRRYVESVRAND